MLLNDLIKHLQLVQKDLGNVPVILSSDTEGNGYGTLKAPYSFCATDNRDGTKVIGLCLFPFNEGYYEAEDAIKESRI